MKHLSPSQSEGPAQVRIDYYDLKMAPNVDTLISILQKRKPRSTGLENL